MARKAEGYVDTSAPIAFADRSDSHQELFRRLFADPLLLLSTTLAMLEDRKPLRVAAVGPAEHAGATSMLRRFADQDLTLADGAGLHLMARERIKSCWSTDFHLGITGVTLILNQ